tara:strand:- start:537 stop:1697 length:1161 start_codon:yes stop_codon:yes gene_type:complete
MKLRAPKQKRIFPAILSVTVLASVGMVVACQVPVFRYALERWTSDRYELVVVPRQGGLTADETAALEYLEATYNNGEVPVNLTARVVEEGENATNAAVVSLYYPGRRGGLEPSPIWTGGLSKENLRRMIDSPARRELATRILQGQSSIWVLVECGDKAKDEEAARVLTEMLEAAKENLELPEGVIGRDEVLSETSGPIDRENILQSDVPLKIDFSILRIDRLNIEESIFLKMFVSLEDDLGELASEPMVFPVFGRGRVLEPLVGQGITEGNIMEYSGYLCGACSCEVKDQNPGMDLLMAVNWDAAIAGSEVIIEKVLPPLEGTAALIAVGEPKKGSAPAAPEPEEPAEAIVEPADEKPFQTFRFVIGLVILLIALGSVFVLRKKQS